MDENRMYTTVQGDMWDYIAWKFYGDEKYISLLFSGNPDQRYTFRSFRKNLTRIYRNGECKGCRLGNHMLL